MQMAHSDGDGRHQGTVGVTAVPGTAGGRADRILAARRYLVGLRGVEMVRGYATSAIGGRRARSPVPVDR